MGGSTTLQSFSPLFIHFLTPAHSFIPSFLGTAPSMHSTDIYWPLTARNFATILNETDTVPALLELWPKEGEKILNHCPEKMSFQLC